MPPGMPLAARPRAPAPGPKAKAKAKGVPALGPFGMMGMGPGMGGFPMGGWGGAPGIAPGWPGMPAPPPPAAAPGWPGMPWPGVPAFPPPAPVASTGPEPATTGPWLHVPLLQYSVLQHLQSGALLEASLTDHTTCPYATLIFSVHSIAGVDAHGVWLEGKFVGCSHPGMAAVFGPMLSMPGFGALIHLCFTPMGCAEVAPNGRQHLHTTMVRTRTKTSLTEPWIGPGWQAYATDDAPSAAASSAKGKPSGASAKGKAPAGGDDDGGGEPASDGMAAGGGKTAREKELAKKLKELKRKFTEQTVVGGGLFARAAQKKSKGLTDDDDETSVFSEAPSLSGGNKIETLALSNPGSLLEAGLSELRRFLSARGGLDGGDVDRLAPVVVQYLRTVYDGAHPPSEQGVRNKNEMELVAECIDSLLRGELPRLGDILMQRLKALQVASKHGWNFAKQLELTNRHDVNLVSAEELGEAARISIAGQKLAESIGKARPPKGFVS